MLYKKITGIIQEESPVQGDGNCPTRKLRESYRKKAQYRGMAVALQENYRNRTSRKPDTGRQLSEKNIARIWIFW